MRCVSSAEIQSVAHGDAVDPLAPAIAHREAGRYTEAAACLTEYLISHGDDARALAHLAHIQLLCRQDAAAHTTLARAQTLAPDSPLVLRNRARLALKSGKIDDASTAITRALVIDPADQENRLIWSAVLAAKGDAGSAMQTLDAVLAERPDYAEALLNRALLHMRWQNPALALADAHLAADIKPHLSQAWRLLAALHAQEQQAEAALLALQHYCDLEPEDVTALAAVGGMLRQNGRADEAAVVLARAVDLKPDFVTAWINYGAALQQLKRIDEAKSAYRKALDIDPNCADAANNLGTVSIEEANWSEAASQFGRALTLKPDYAEARMNLGVALKKQGKLDEAITHFQHALRLKPDDAEAHCNLGNALRELKRPEEALRSYDRAIALRPTYAQPYSNRGIALLDLKRSEEALASCDKALALKPDDPEAYTNRGIVLLDLKRSEEALASYDKAIALKPDYAKAYSDRGTTLLQHLKRPEEALKSCDKAIALQPDYADAHHNRGSALKKLNRFDEAVASYDRAIALEPNHKQALGGLAECAIKRCDWVRRDKMFGELRRHVMERNSVIEPFLLMGYSDDELLLLQCAKNFVQERIAVPPKPVNGGTIWRNDKIKVAYLSANFRRHSMGYVTAELYERHDRSRFEVIGVSFGDDDRSELRARLMAGFDQFIDVRSKSDEEVARLLSDLRIDIAVDLMGHTGDSRPGILALRPAPIQVNYLGFPGTMGANFIDYIIADATILPFDKQPQYTERIVHLPDCYQVNDKELKIAERTPTQQEIGLPDHAFVFCCFNNNWKITPAMFDIWMRLLHRVEGSVLWLTQAVEGSEVNLRKEAAARGIDPLRLVFAKPILIDQYLARHRFADLFLDTLPYNAHATASHALWAGLPVLTCCGESFAGRVATSLLHAIGLPELVTYSLDEYEALALRLAADGSLLRGLRERLKQNRLRFPLFDTDRFCRHIEAAYITMWQYWQRGESPQSFRVEPLALSAALRG
jgi:predicted O-linked N-acetylglucosamine transferase (SPINDLY family)